MFPDSDTPLLRGIPCSLAGWHFGQQQVRDAPKCTGRHAHYNDKVNEWNLLFGPASKGVGKLRKLCRAWDRSLQLFFLNEECLVDALHQSALTTSLPFVHTARRCYRCQLDTDQPTSCLFQAWGEVDPYLTSRGSKSRNKVAVGEPAAGSFREFTNLENLQHTHCGGVDEREFFLQWKKITWADVLHKNAGIFYITYLKQSAWLTFYRFWTTHNGGCLGFPIDEGRSNVR